MDYRMTIGGCGDEIEVKIVDSEGEVVATDSTAAVPRMLDFSPRPDSEYFLVLEARAATVLWRRHHLPIKVAALPH